MQNMKRLRWQCRRGVKELDAILCAFLDNRYTTATLNEQQLFIQLLALEDDQLLAYFFVNRLPANYKAIPPENVELKQFVKKIRSAFMG